jgi:DNA-binding beta-propeller fold protein YncE
VGNGEQGRDRRGGRAGREQELNSPWDVALSGDGGTLYVAMAGPHQLWQVDLATRVAKVLAGSGIENIADGPAAGAQLAQPSGLALSGDGTRLYFADSEVSAVRYLDLTENRVHTIIGTGLFDFGDVDGVYPSAKLQHPLGVAVFGDKVLVADTYNHKIKLIDPDERRVERWLEAGLAEPGGLSLAGGRLFIADTNNGRVLMVDVETREVVEVTW